MNPVNLPMNVDERLALIPQGDADKLRQEILVQIQKVEQREKGRQILTEAGVIYLDPTYDKTFKWLMGEDNATIARTIFDSVIFLSYKGLASREVESFNINSLQFDSMTEQLRRLPSDLSSFQQLMMDVPAELKLGEGKGNENGRVDQLDDATTINIDDIVNKFFEIFVKNQDREKTENVINTIRDKLKTELQIFEEQMQRRNDIASVKEVAEVLSEKSKMVIDIEMQRSKQMEIEARTLMYGAIMLLSRKAENLLPMLLVSICQWQEAGVVNDVFHAVIAKNSKNPVPISQVAININEPFDPVNASEDVRREERRRVKDVFKENLRKMFPELIKEGEKFSALWKESASDKVQVKRNKLRTAYEVLCFLRLAPLTPKLKDGKRVFNKEIKKAYNMIEMNNTNVQPDISEYYVGVANARQEANAARQEANAIREEAIKSYVEAGMDFIQYGDPDDRIERWARREFSEEGRSVGIKQEVIKRLDEREVEADKEENKRRVIKILKKI